MSVYSEVALTGPEALRTERRSSAAARRAAMPRRALDSIKIDEDDLIAPLSQISKQELGRVGEDVAARFLVSEGYEIIERNWRCRRGEIDLVARDPEGTTALVEVKTRRAGRHMDCEPEVAVDQRKRERYGVLAQLYVLENGKCYPMRCDVVSVTVGSNAWARVRLTPGAFTFDAA